MNEIAKVKKFVSVEKNKIEIGTKMLSLLTLATS